MSTSATTKKQVTEKEKRIQLAFIQSRVMSEKQCLSKEEFYAAIEDKMHEYIIFNEQTIQLTNVRFMNMNKLYLISQPTTKTLQIRQVRNPNEPRNAVAEHSMAEEIDPDNFLAYFYPSYKFISGFQALLHNQDDLKYFKIFIDFDVPQQALNTIISTEVKLYLLIHRNYLLNVIESSRVPSIIQQTLTVNGIKDARVYRYDWGPVLKPATSCALHKKDIEDLLKVELYQYQRNNLEWMTEIEMTPKQIQAYNVDGLYFYDIKSINEKIYFNPGDWTLYNTQKLSESNRSITLPIKGGILTDEMGLGKTLCMFSLILNNPNKTLYTTQKVDVEPIQPLLTNEVTETKVEEPEPTPKKRGRKKKVLESESKTEPEITPVKKPRKKKTDTKEVTKTVEPIYPLQMNGNKTRSRATLIIGPSRLCKQWFDEINKYMKEMNLKVIVLSTIVNLRNCTLYDLATADIVIIPANFFINENYIVHSLQLNTIYWHRIIIDEAHEIIQPAKHDTMKRVKNEDETITRVAIKHSTRLLSEYILSLRSEYKWLMTGTPFAHGSESLHMYMLFLTEYNKYYTTIASYSPEFLERMTSNTLPSTVISIFTDLVKNYMRMNTKESVKQEVIIPPVIEETIFLKQTPIEQAIYNAAAGDTNRQIQLCTHVLISEYDANILGTSRVLKLEDMKDVLVKHYTEQKEKFADLLAKKKEELSETERIKSEQLAKIELSWKVLTDKKAINDLKAFYETNKQRYDLKIADCQRLIKEYENNLRENTMKSNMFTELNKQFTETPDEPCSICMEPMETIGVSTCGHAFCTLCFEHLWSKAQGQQKIHCPMCRIPLAKKDIQTIVRVEPERKEAEQSQVNKYGTKMAKLLEIIAETLMKDPSNRIILFSQWDKMLNMVGEVLDEANIRHVYVKGNVHVISNAIRRFKLDPSFRIIMLSSESASSGSNLTEANHIILLDTMNASKETAHAIENQAIGRVSRIGQKQQVKVTRLVMTNTIEHQYYIRNMEMN
jgi:SNF2 family DNA or RNA helicase